MKKRKLLTLTQRKKKKKKIISHPPHQSIDQISIEDKRAILLSDINNFYGEHLESQYINNVYRELFFNLCNDYKLNVNTLFTKVLTLREKHRLNIFLRTIKEKNGIRIMDSLIFLEEKHAKFNQLLKCLDQENDYIVKLEAAELDQKYKIESNHLKDFLEFEKK